LLAAVLPLRQLDAETVLQLVAQTQQQNYAAACAHRRHRGRCRVDSS
jgi:hypothetical protein